MTSRWSAPRALLFDLDGTLVHSLPDIADAVDATLRSYGVPELGETSIGTMIGNGSRVLIERALNASRWCGGPVHSAELLAEVHQRFLAYYRQHVCVRTTLCPGVFDQLPQLKAAGIALAVVTNKPIEFVAPILIALSIAEHFSVLLGGNSLAEKKPSGLPLLHACAQLGVAVSEAIMVGDSSTDIAAARAAKMRVVAVSFGYNHGEPLTASSPDWIVDDLKQLPALWQ